MADIKETKDAAEVAPIDTPEVVAPVAAPSDSTDHVAIRDFGALFDHQLLRFVEGEVIDSRVGAALRALGSPIKLVEREFKGKK